MPQTPVHNDARPVEGSSKGEFGFRASAETSVVHHETLRKPFLCPICTAIGLRGQESTGALIRNIILCEAERAVDDRMDSTPAKPVIDYNLTFETAPLAGEGNLNGKAPPLRRCSKAGMLTLFWGRDGIWMGMSLASAPPAPNLCPTRNR